jgi:Flp pilus assembly protein TadD
MLETNSTTSIPTTSSNKSLNFLPEKLNIYMLTALIVVTILGFFHILSLYFITFDEKISTIANIMKQINWDIFKNIYTEQNNFTNYFSYFVLQKQFQWYEFSPKGYHFISYFLHISNVALVFYATYLLSRKNMLALLASILFALHPSHAETISAILAQGELLMTFFALLSLICYLLYLNPQKISALTTKETTNKFIYFSFLCYLMAVFSKFTAAPLPLIFILVDYVKSRKGAKIWIEKLAFWLVMLFAIGLAMVLQENANTKTYFAVPNYNFLDRIILSLATIGVYLKNLCLPFGLSPFYPYPAKSGFLLEWTVYLYALLPFILGFAVWKLRKHTLVVFGFLFLLLQLFLISNILPLGGRTFATDTHSYFAGIGIFIVFAYAIMYVIHLKPTWYLQILGTTTIVSIGLFVMTYQYDKCFAIGISVWTKMVETNPTHYYPHLKRGEIYTLNENTYRESMLDVNAAVKLMPDDPEAWNSKGVVHLHIGDYHGADSVFNEVLKRNPNHAMAYFHKAHISKGFERYEESLENYNKSIAKNPNYAPAYLNRGGILYHFKQYDAALANYTKAIQLSPNYVEAYQNRGNIYYAAQKREQALKDYNKALELNPQNPEVLFYRGLLRNSLGDKVNACTDLNAAKELGKKEASQAIKEICR